MDIYAMTRRCKNLLLNMVYLRHRSPSRGTSQEGQQQYRRVQIRIDNERIYSWVYIASLNDLLGTPANSLSSFFLHQELPKLSQEDVELIESLDKNEHYCQSPDPKNASGPKRVFGWTYEQMGWWYSERVIVVFFLCIYALRRGLMSSKEIWDTRPGMIINN